MADLSTNLVANLIDGISAPAKAASASLDKITRSASAVSNVDIGRSFRAARADFAMATGALLGTVAAMGALYVAVMKPIEAARTFEERLVSIGIKGDLTRNQIDALGKMFRSLGAEVDQSGQDLADAAQKIPRSILQSVSLTREVLKQASQLSVAYNEPVVDMTKAVSGLMTAWNVKPQDLGGYVDRMGKAAKLGKVSVADMADNMGKWGLSAKTMKLSGTRDFSAMAAIMEQISKYSNDGAEGAGDLTKFLNQAFAPKNLGKMKDAGVDLMAIINQKHLKSSAVFDLFAALDKASKGGQADLIGKMLGPRGAQLLKKLVGEMDAVKKKAEEIDNSVGTVARDAKRHMDSWENAWHDLGLAAKDAQLGIGLTLGKELAPNIESIAGLIRQFTAFTEKNPTYVLNFVKIAAALTALSAAVASLNFMFSGLRLVVEGVFLALSFFGAVGSIVGGIIAVGAAVFYLSQNWDKVKKSVLQIAEVAKPAALKLYQEFLAVDWASIGTKILDAIATTLRFIADVGKTAGQELYAAFLKIDWVAVGTQIVESIWSGLKSAWSTVMGWASGAATSLGNAFKGMIGGASRDKGPGTGPMGTQGAFGNNVQNMINEGNSTGHPLSMVSGYRSTANQSSIWARSLHGRLFKAAPPGRSMHQAGEAADLAGSGLGWAHENANRFGLHTLRGDRPHFSSNGRARGGRVNAGGSYVVGENGWEIFRPNQSGSIANQKQLGGGGGIHFAPVINVSGGNASDIEHRIRNVLRDEVRQLFRSSYSDVGMAAG